MSDTVHHRLYTCQLERVRDARDEAGVSQEFMNAAREFPDIPVFTTGIHIYQDSELPCPSTSSDVYLYDRQGNPLDMEPEEIASLTSSAPLRLASDGSSSMPLIRPLQRASWAIAVCPDEGEDPVAVVKGIVPGSLPQTPAMAEHVGIALCGQIATRPTELGADCQAAIRVVQRNVSDQLSLSNKFAGVRAFAHELEGTTMINTVRHVKAHRDMNVIQ